MGAKTHKANKSDSKSSRSTAVFIANHRIHGHANFSPRQCIFGVPPCAAWRRTL